MPEALLATLVLLPAVLTFLLKSNAAVSFLALCGGFTVITLSGSDVQHLLGKTKITSLTSNDLDLILLVLPLLLTLLFTFKSATSKQLRVLHIIPALCAGALLAIVAAPMFNEALNTDFTKISAWRTMQDVQSYIIGAGLLLSLLLIWTSGFSHTKKHGKKHK
jgi:hypothetical protein